MGLLEGERILIMGLLNTHSLAWAIGEKAAAEGADVTYTVQNERFRDVLLRRSFKQEGLDIDDYSILPCDVTSDADIVHLFETVPEPIHGLVHSIAYANPETCLTNSMFDAPREDLIAAFSISAASLGLILKEGRHHLADGAGIVALTFNTLTSFPGYDWMGVTKAALEASVRYLARDLGRHQVRINCLSAGPLETMAASKIAGFEALRDFWPAHSPLGWDPEADRDAVADTAIFLLSRWSRKITGETIYVDGGFHITRAAELDEEV